MQPMRIPRYKGSKASRGGPGQKARTDSGIVPNKKRSKKKIRASPSGTETSADSNSLTDVTAPPPAPTPPAPTPPLLAPPNLTPPRRTSPRPSPPAPPPPSTPPTSNPAPTSSTPPATNTVEPSDPPKPRAGKVKTGATSTVGTSPSVTSGKSGQSGVKKPIGGQKKRSSMRGPRKKQVAPLGRTDLEGIDEIDLIAPAQTGVAPKSEMVLLKEAKRLWLEFSEENEPGSQVKGFKYGVFNAKHSKIIIATPIDELGQTKPQYFNLTTIRGEKVCELRYTTGSFCKQNIKIQVKMHDESIGSVKQVSNSLIVFEQTGQEIMRFTGVPRAGVCNRRGPDAFNCEVYLSERSYHHSVGVFGKNSKKAEQVMLGVASGFYFIAAKGTQDEFDVFHKVFILSAMVTLMTYCEFLANYLVTFF